MYSSPPVHGAELVIRMLNNEAHTAAWKAELKATAQRILTMRRLLVEGLQSKGTPGTWSHITRQIGMFSFTGLSPEQCTYLTEHYSIYLLKTGRVSLAGLNAGNIQYVVDAVEKGWVMGWERKNFKDKKNPDLWKRFLKVYRQHRVAFHWVKGHAGNPNNERVDALAVAAYQTGNLGVDEAYESTGNA